MRDIIAIGSGGWGEFREHLLEKETDTPLTETDLRNVRAQATRQALDWQESETDESMRGKQYRVLRGTVDPAPTLGESILQMTHDILGGMGYKEANYPCVYVDDWLPDESTISDYLNGIDR